MSGPPTREEIARREKERLEEKKRREAEWDAKHPDWFTCIMKDNAPGLYTIVMNPEFDLEQRYRVTTEATPLGWAVIANRAKLVQLLIERGANRDANIKFFNLKDFTPLEYCQLYKVKDALGVLESAQRKV